MLYAVATWSEVSVLLLWQEEEVSAGIRFIFWGFWSWMKLFLLQTFMVCNYMLECVFVYHIVIRMYCHLCCQEFAHTTTVCTVFKFALMCQWCGGYHNRLWTFLFSAVIPLQSYSCSVVLPQGFICNCLHKCFSLFHSFPPLCPSFWFLMDCIHCVCLVLWCVNIRLPFVMYSLFSLLLSWAPPLMSGGVPVDAGYLCSMIAMLGVVIKTLHVSVQLLPLTLVVTAVMLKII